MIALKPALGTCPGNVRRECYDGGAAARSGESQ
jgi:hypothetical protein